MARPSLPTPARHAMHPNLSERHSSCTLLVNTLPASPPAPTPVSWPSPRSAPSRSPPRPPAPRPRTCSSPTGTPTPSPASPGPGTFATTGTNLSGGLSGPEGLVFDARGDLFAANFGTNSITEFAAGVTPGSLGTGMVVETSLSGPIGLAFDKNGDLFAANFNAGSITEFASTGPGTFGAGTTFTTGLNGPDGLAVNARGDLFVSSQNGGSAGQGSITEFVSTGAGTFGAVTSFTAPSLNFPDGLAFDNNGDLFAANQDGNSITEFAAGATPGSLGAGTTFATGLNLPTGLGVDARGDLFAANFGASSITEFASTGAGTFAAGRVVETGLSNPTLLAFGPSASAPVPEASTTASLGLLLALGLGGLVVSARRRKAASAL